MITNNISQKQCTGCMACYNVCPKSAISMKSNAEGFWYPIINKVDCIDCGVCVSVCPELNCNKIKREKAYKAYACVSSDDSILMNSSSGGLFADIANFVLNKNGIVYGAYNESIYKVVHAKVTDCASLKKVQGSKYVQSYIGYSYREIKKELLEGRYVLFSGTPCQVAAIKSYLKHEYDNLLCIDLICHGVPSPRMYSEYIRSIEQRNNWTISEYKFRSKRRLGMNCDYSISYKNKSGREKIESKSWINSSFYYFFMKGEIYRPSCYNCKYATLERCSDLTIGDYWGMNKLKYDIDYSKGISVGIVNTEKGERMINMISNKKCETTISDAVRYNESAVRPTPYNPKREIIFDVFMKDGIKGLDKLYKKDCSIIYKLQSNIYDVIPYRLKEKIKKVLRMN